MDCKGGRNNKVNIRSPNSTRPWQHVLELEWLYYFILQFKKIKKLTEVVLILTKTNEIATVKNVLKLSSKYWDKAKFKIYKEKFFKEDPLLKLNSIKAQKILKWKKILSLQKTLELTMTWYRDFYKNNTKVKNLLDRDINYFLSLKENIFND